LQNEKAKQREKNNFHHTYISKQADFKQSFQSAH